MKRFRLLSLLAALALVVSIAIAQNTGAFLVTDRYIGAAEVHVSDYVSATGLGGLYIHDDANVEYAAHIALPALSGDVTFTLPSASGTFATTSGTLASPTLTSPTISGTVAGGAIYTAPTLTSPTFSGTVTRDTQWFQIAPRAKAGTTAGWVVGAGDDLGLMATCPASQTASTLVVPIDHLHIGDVITGFGVVAQIESAGGTVTLDCDLRALTAADADFTDASLATLTQISVAADDSFDGVTTGTKESITVTVTAGKKYYFLVTATTAGSTDIALAGLTLKINQR